MALNGNPIFVKQWRNKILNLRPADSTNARLGFLAGANGSRIHALNVASSDTSARDVIRFLGQAVTLASNGGTIQYAGATTITRSVGSFVTDGWKVGDKCIPIGSTTASNDKELTITAVAALTLTFTESQTNEVIPSTVILYKCAQLTQSNIPLTSGFLNSAKSVDCLKDNVDFIDATPNRYLTLGFSDFVNAASAPDALIFAMGAAITAAKKVDIAIFGGDY